MSWLLILEPEEADGAGTGMGADDSAQRRRELDLGFRPHAPDDLAHRANPFRGVRVPIDAHGAQTLKVRVELLGRSVELTVPTEVSVEPERVEARGEFELTHADLGMQPFTVMMGALQVGEKLSFSYRIVARLVP